MKVDWGPLRQELAVWRRDGMDLPIWWRDDDAIEPTEALEHLSVLSHELALPVHLAVIPALAGKPLADRCSETPHLIPLVHGWRHETHALEGQKKAEFGRPRDGATAQLRYALARMRVLFGTDFEPIFVPPWNRIDPALVADLDALGYIGLSTFTPRKDPFASPRLTQVNCHVDPIDWRGTRSLLDPQELVIRVVATLQARRSGETDRAEPLGYLSHHLVHTPEVWTFSRAFLSELLDGGAHGHTFAEHLKEIS